jgi:integrase
MTATMTGGSSSPRTPAHPSTPPTCTRGRSRRYWRERSSRTSAWNDLRHTCATLLLNKGTHPKFVQELLGHATVAITVDTYSHVMPGMGDKTARAMQDALS